MKWGFLVLFLPFTPGSWWVHVAVISLIYTDWGLTGKGNEMYISRKEGRCNIRGGDISPAVE
jgi:hypothetical protein